MLSIFSISDKYSLCIFLILLFSSSISYAEIFKWVDENGQTHYADTKVSVGKSKVEAFKLDSMPNIMTGHKTAPSAALKEDTLGSKLRKIQKQAKQKIDSPYSKNSKRNWGGEGPETEDKRCALARDIISGTARHTNGVPTDAHDMKVAQRDVRKFCR